jgi:hypothetical protein
MLEGRMMSEKRMLLEVDKKDGERHAYARPQEYIDGTGGGYMRDAVFTVYSDGMEGQTQYFYVCVSNRDKPLEGQIPEEKVGTITDSNGKIFTAAQLGLIPGYVNKLSVACQPVYDDLAKWRKTFCANLKNKTKPNYAWNCPEAAQPIAAAADTSSNPDESPQPIPPMAAEAIKAGNLTWKEVDGKIRYFSTGKLFDIGTKNFAGTINMPTGTDVTKTVLFYVPK